MRRGIVRDVRRGEVLEGELWKRIRIEDVSMERDSRRR